MKFRLIFLISLCLIGATHSYGQSQGFDLANYGVRIEPDKRLMAVLATLEMAQTRNPAGETVAAIKTPLTANGEKFRATLLADNTGLSVDLRQRISSFVAQYKRQRPNASDAEIVAPFVSMAYTLAPVPDLADPAVTSDLPGSLLDVLDFAPLVREFYRKSTLAAKFDDYLKLYRSDSDSRLRPSAREMVSELLDYLHTRPATTFVERRKIETLKTGSKKQTIEKIESVNRERRFFVVPEMLIASDSVIFLNIRDDYHVIVPADKDLSSSDARRAFLQFVVDPLVYRNSKDIATIRDAVKGILDERRKIDPTVSPDVFLTISRSLIAAVDARQEEYVTTAIGLDQARRKIDAVKTDAERREATASFEKIRQVAADETALRLSEDYEKGAVLAFYFAEALRGVEDSGFDIASSLREMIASFDASKEKGRLEANADARKRALSSREARRTNPAAPPVIDNPVTAKLLEISKTIDARDLAKAQSELKVLLAKNPGDARIYYSIGRVASLAAEGETDAEVQAQRLLDAKTAYSNVLNIKNATTDPALLSQTYVNLARIYAFMDGRAMAAQLYDKAIQIGDVPDGAYREALAAKQKLLKP
ncbi:MAG: hypothetical protein H0X08_00850 [Blastocatellia bacterium]|nr:hypothetical protein [Blastocatellia bacterium]